MTIPAYRSDGHSGKGGALARVNKRIRLRQQDLARASDLTDELKVSPVVGRVLAARGFSPGEDLKNYFKKWAPRPESLKELKRSG